MKASCVIDSEGRVIDTSELSNVLNIRNPNKRAAELEEFIGQYIICLWHRAVSITTEGFVYKIQPNFVEERLYAFFKIPLDASDPLIKRAYLYKNKQLNDDLTPNEINLLKSVYSTPVREKTVWYILYAQELMFERNIYDGEWEKITTQSLLTYKEFTDMVKTDIQAVKNDPKNRTLGNRNYLYSKEWNFADIEGILKNAATIDNDGCPLSEPLQKFSTALKDYRKKMGFDRKKAYGNQALYCLYAINDLAYSDKVFPIYYVIKKIIRKTFPSAYNIRYEKTIISFEYDNKVHTIYVCDPLNKQYEQTLIINGRIINDPEALRDNFAQVLTPCLWYDEIVLPNVKFKQER